MKPPKPKKTQLCLITNRKLLSPSSDSLNVKESISTLLNHCIEAAYSGIDIIQIREKDLSAKDLSQLVNDLSKELKSLNTTLLVNDRLDIALSCGANGVHLPGNSLPIKEVRKYVGKDFIVSVSTHSVEEACLAAESGASFVLFSPIFDTPSKRIYGKPLGLELLSQATKKITCPVIALGGINRENAKSVLDCGAWGLAAIRLFIESSNLRDLVNELKQ
jgi:thiamine-phosphate pyrophosphorylase